MAKHLYTRRLLTLAGLALSLSACQSPMMQQTSPDGTQLQPSAATQLNTVASSRPGQSASPTSPSAPQSSQFPVTLPSAVSQAPGMTGNIRAEVFPLSRQEGKPGENLVLQGSGLEQITRIFLGGQIAEIRQQSATELTFIIPKLTDGRKSLEIFTELGKLSDLAFMIRGGVTDPSSGGGGGAPGGGNNPAPTPVATLPPLPYTPVDQLDLIPEITTDPPTLAVLPEPDEMGGLNLQLELPHQEAGIEPIDQRMIPNPDADLQAIATPKVSMPGPNLSRINLIDPVSRETTTVGLGVLTPTSQQQEGFQTQSINGKYVGYNQSNELSYLKYDPPLTAANNVSLPSTVNLMSQMPPVRNQGARGTCTFFATAGLVDYLGRKAGYLNLSVAPGFLTWVYQKEYSNYPLQNGSSGVELSEGSHINLVLDLLDANTGNNQYGWSGTSKSGFYNQGVPEEAYFPYSQTVISGSISSKSAIDKARTMLGDTQLPYLQQNAFPEFKIRSYLIDKPSGNEQAYIRNLKSVLLGGRPIVLAVYVQTSVATTTGITAGPWSLWRKTSLADATILDISSNQGGHAILLVGYQDDTNAPGGGYFIFRNSWSTDWGYQGYARISYKYINERSWDPVTADWAGPSSNYYDPAQNKSQIEVTLKPHDIYFNQYYGPANLPNETRYLVIEAEATGKNPIRTVVPYSEQGKWQRLFKIQVPPGVSWKIKARALDANQNVLVYGESALTSVSQGQTAKVEINLAAPVNLPPVISSASAQPSSLAGAGHSTHLNCAAMDPEGSPLSYSWATVGGNFGNFGNPSSAQTYWSAPIPANASYTLRCTVSDGVNSQTQDIAINVANGSGNLNGNGGFH